MKKLLLTVITIICVNLIYAQQTCHIIYRYDNAGQRIKRFYECSIQGTGTTADVRVAVFPNPTAGPVSVFADDIASTMLVTVVSSSGQLIASSSCEECNHIDLDISPAAPGSYIVEVLLKRTGKPDFKKGFTIIKTD